MGSFSFLLMCLYFEAHKIPIPSGMLRSALFSIFKYALSSCALRTISGFGVTMKRFLLFFSFIHLSIVSKAFASVILSKSTPSTFIFFRICILGFCLSFYE